MQHDAADVALAVIDVVMVVVPRAAGAVFGGALEDQHYAITLRLK